MPTRLTMCALLLLLLAAIVNVDAASGQKEIVAETSGIRAKRNAAIPDECVSGQRSEQRCHGFDVLCRFGSSQGRCLNDTCICPEVPNRDLCTCLPRVGDCHVRRSPESASVYSCLVPDNLNSNYDVHILSVYEATSSRASGTHPTGTSNVRLSLSGVALKPIVLVLVSYEPVEWRLTVPSEVEIERVLLSSYYPDTTRVVGVSSRVTTVEKVGRQELPYGYGLDSRGRDTVKLIESTVARFGPIASFRGTYRSNSWTLSISQRNNTNLPDCGYPPLPVDGTASLANTTRGVEVEYSCFADRALNGAHSAVCLDNGNWNASAPTCPYHCSCPPTPANGRVTGCPGSTVTYHCNSGYALSGSSQRTCQSGGRWRGLTPTCISVASTPCPCPPAPANGYLSGCPGTSVTYHCNDGYVSSGNGHRICKSNRRWSGSASRCILASSVSCADEEDSGKRCSGSDFFCRFGSSQGVCVNDTCRCPNVPNRDSCTCLPWVGDCHVRRSPESANVYSCLVPDNLNPNYDVHIISVYRATSLFFRTVNVKLSLSAAREAVKPIVLVLVSHDPVVWSLTVHSRVEIERVLLSSYYPDTTRVVSTSRILRTVEKVSRQEFPYGDGLDSGGGNTVKLIESTVARFGPIASFRGTSQSNSWTLTVTQRNRTRLSVNSNSNSQAASTNAGVTAGIVGGVIGSFFVALCIGFTAMFFSLRRSRSAAVIHRRPVTLQNNYQNSNGNLAVSTPRHIPNVEGNSTVPPYPAYDVPGAPPDYYKVTAEDSPPEYQAEVPTVQHNPVVQDPSSTASHSPESPANPSTRAGPQQQ